jgi:hypothetical protein
MTYVSEAMEVQNKPSMAPRTMCTAMSYFATSAAKWGLAGSGTSSTMPHSVLVKHIASTDTMTRMMACRVPVMEAVRHAAASPSPVLRTRLKTGRREWLSTSCGM